MNTDSIRINKAVVTPIYQFAKSNITASPTCKCTVTPISSVVTSSVLMGGLDSSVLLAPLKAPKSYGTYTKQQQDDVIAFIKDGNSLRTAEKVFGIPKSTMHCWLKKLQTADDMASGMDMDTYPEYNNLEKDNQNRRSQTQEVTSEKPRTQIVLEEVELIRFLQTSEGAEMISKAYNVSVSDFHKFVVESRKQNKLQGLLVRPGEQKRVEVLGFVRDPSKANSISSNSSADRKRHFSDGADATSQYQSSDNYIKRIKTESLSSPTSSLVSLLTAKRAENENGLPKTLVLTPEQLLTASKLISRTQPGVVNTYISTKPLVNTLLVPPDAPLVLAVDGRLKESPRSDQSELSPTFPKIISPVSIKAERIDDCMLPPSVPVMKSSHDRHIVRTLTSNTSAMMNLNEINRTQSEKELMALVDEEDISADELCSDFDNGLHMNNWIDNEAWYADQYLQHFQVSPTSSPAAKTDMMFDDEPAPGGITFSSNLDKAKILSFIAEGNSVEEAERIFNVPQSTINSWNSSSSSSSGSVSSNEPGETSMNEVNNRPNPSFESAFFKPLKPSSMARSTHTKSVFSKSIKK